MSVLPEALTTESSMCRLYAFRATERTKVECTLAHAQNALLLQSRGDLAGRSHTDGWGMASWKDGMPTIKRQSTAAYRDLSFSHAAAGIYSTAVVAHVRMATVGEPRDVNSHPFGFGKWVFAHNGTVIGFSVLKHQLLAETDSTLRKCIQGETDSEHLFFWLLSRMRDAHINLEADSDIGSIAELLCRSIRELAERSSTVDTHRPSKLNIVLTNGDAMFVSRWNNTLFFTRREGVADCEICGIPHIHHEVGSEYRAVVVASEPISDEPWEEVPNGSLLAIDRKVRLRSFAISPENRQPPSQVCSTQGAHS